MFLSQGVLMMTSFAATRAVMPFMPRCGRPSINVDVPVFLMTALHVP